MAGSDTPNGQLPTVQTVASPSLRASPTPSRATTPMARLRLNTLSDLAKEHRKLYREARGGVISTSEATKLAYLLSTLANLMNATDIEARLAALEGQDEC